MMRSALRIIVGTDGSADATAAIDWAAAEAHRRRAPLVIAHVGHPDLVALRSDVKAIPMPGATTPPAYVDDTVARVASEWAGLEVSSLTLAGGAASALIGVSEQSSLVVVGARGRSRVAEVLLGSVSRHVSAHARCPVVVVHAITDRTSWPVAVGVDGSPASRLALREAAAEATLLGVKLLVVHAWRDETYTGYGVYTAPADITRELEQEAEQLTAAEVASLADEHPDLDVLLRVAQVHPVTAMLQASREAQLVAVGAHGHGFFRGMGQGSVTAGVVHGAECPVLVVPLAAAR